MFDYLKNAVAKTVSNSLISLAGYVGGYSLVDPTDKHGVKNSHLLCKGKVICIPFYHGGHSCQVYLNFDRSNFDEVAYGVLFPDGKIIDITTGCPGLGSPLIHADKFGPECQLIWSYVLHKFPNHLNEMNEEDYYLYGDAVETPEAESVEGEEQIAELEGTDALAFWNTQNETETAGTDHEELSDSESSGSDETDFSLNVYDEEVVDPNSDLLQ
jgi:hypothetical protein